MCDLKGRTVKFLTNIIHQARKHTDCPLHIITLHVREAPTADTPGLKTNTCSKLANTGSPVTCAIVPSHHNNFRVDTTGTIIITISDMNKVKQHYFQLTPRLLSSAAPFLNTFTHAQLHNCQCTAHPFHCALSQHRYRRPKGQEILSG